MKKSNLIILFFVFFQGNLMSENRRDQTFAYALQLMSERDAKVIVETGTARFGKKNIIGDGGSTYIFGHWASKNKAVVYSVDIDEQALERAEDDLDEAVLPYVLFIHADALDFLNKFPEKIDFLYLDSFDFDIHNPMPSQEHHLKEIMAAYPRLKETSIILIDDCDLPHGGKGRLVIDYLKERNWYVAMKGYQVVLLKHEKITE